jgi:hypothetical protein
VGQVRIGVVLGGGGTVGYGWHTGVLRGLHEVVGIDPREAAEMVGTSAGSYAVAYTRAGISGADLFALAVGDKPSAAGAEMVALGGPMGELAAPGKRALRPSDATVLKEAWPR